MPLYVSGEFYDRYKEIAGINRRGGNVNEKIIRERIRKLRKNGEESKARKLEKLLKEWWDSKFD